MHYLYIIIGLWKLEEKKINAILHSSMLRASIFHGFLHLWNFQTDPSARLCYKKNQENKANYQVIKEQDIVIQNLTNL